MASKSKLKFEREITRLHVEKFFEGLGPEPKGVHLVIIPNNGSLTHWYRVAEEYVRDVKNSLGDGMKTGSKGTVEDLIVEDAEFRFTADNGPSSFAVDVQLLGASGIDDRYELDTCSVLLSGEGNENLEHPSLVLVDSRTVVELDLNLIVQAAATCGRPITRVEAWRLSRMPHRRRNVAFHSPRPISKSHALQAKAATLEREKQEAERLEREKAETTKRRPADVRTVPHDVPYLEDMHGYGPAAEWGHELAADMEDWRRGNIRWNDVDNGVLLSGPPGCGKTTFAKSLARSLDAHFVAGSYSSWLGTGDGHQGNLLLAMRAAFAEAMKHAPSVLLIDEIDNFVARGSIGNGRSDEWNRGVVNGLLECLDGAVEREGVVVVGATNDPSGIDTALRRPGRLDRHIEIPLPDAKARSAILRQHLDANIDVTCLDRETEGMSGADLERVARDARRRARRERVDVGIHHVRASLPVRQSRTPAYRRHIAVHEIGHAVVAVATGSRVREVFVEPDFVADQPSHIAGAAVVSMREGIQDYQWHMDRVAHCLGGLAAEKMIYGSHSDSVSVDLVNATNAARNALASYGMGGSLYSHGVAGMTDLARAQDFDPGLRQSIDGILHDQAARARAILEEHREAVAELVEMLLQHHRLDGAVVHEVVARPRRQLALAI
ncbi:AAA family ATPase [Shinella zoogloeoides]|uniref:AAA family ATPase n=1 Tax=Shinella zoogloeoides TaxID=352475 RepID=UPI0028A6A387|nr:AAA family ATPase [Shinella zoogloeoides]